ncbi:hypothetical protein C8C76_1342 [Halanaerobium saccharolyticum]|uniref:Uncharacterized protein n=1 Tax=Halanaerobium saccharolyticum TaxID=43595 RepID=A0A2T5RGP3_9FIRM|nr:DUF6765 family protein [Halanaerobium saccharolyticum]PTV94073.1 hypothetical protein C8C76_1342 [Halanaerobium saccharolyticum]
MNIEFHYYMTYLITVRAGFKPAEAEIIAYSSQYIDDNDLIYNIDQNSNHAYSNYISQTKNITRPKKNLFRIYPVFHFIPGDPLADSARRRDGKLHLLNTTPDSKNARQVLKLGLSSNNLYKIGLAIHSFADSFAHQNFVGYYDEFNLVEGIQQKLSSIFDRSVYKIGHAAAGHRPDIPHALWHDPRLCRSNSRRDNKEIFLKAAGRIFEELKKHKDPSATAADIESEKEELLADLAAAIGKKSECPELFKVNSRKRRLNCCQKLSLKKEYGAEKLKDYDPSLWFNEAVKINTGFLKIDRSCSWQRLGLDYFSKHFKFLKSCYSWKSESYQKTHWFKFQESVKEMQEEIIDLLDPVVFERLELANW